MVLRFSGLSAPCLSPWLEYLVLRLILSWRLSECWPGFLWHRVEKAGLQVHPLLETPQRNSAGDNTEGNKAWLLHCPLCYRLLLKEKKCNFLSASKWDLPLAGIWYVAFPAPKQSQAIEVGSTRADRGWMVIAFLYLLAAHLVQQALRESFLINWALSWAAHARCQWAL